MILKKFVNKIKELGIKGVLLMHLGFLCCAVSSVVFLSPSGLIPGGATGLSLLLSNVTSVDYYIWLYGINFSLLIIGFIVLGTDFTIKTIYGSLMLPTFGALVTWILRITNVDIASLIAGCDTFMVVIFSSVLMGFGIGINMKLGGSTGGFDILETILYRFLHVSYSTSMYILDAVLVVLGMVFFTPANSIFLNAFAEGLSAILYIIFLGLVVDTITFGGYNKRAVFIRSKNYEEIHDIIIKGLYRGMTYLSAEGGYSHEATKMIVCICYSREYFILREKILKIDPNAFLFVTKATEVRGLGFSIENPNRSKYFKKKKEELSK